MARPLLDPDLDRKIAIAVFELVAAHGVDGLGVRKVAQAAGVSTGTLNYRFGNKAGLLAAALDFAYAPPPGWGEEPGTATERLRRLCQRYVLRDDKRRLWWRFFLAASAHAAKDRALVARLRRNHRALVQFFAAGIAFGVERGELSIEGSAEAEASRLLSLAYGLALGQLLFPGATRIDEAAQTLDGELARMRAPG